jgi:hypothetical protein
MPRAAARNRTLGLRPLTYVGPEVVFSLLSRQALQRLSAVEEITDQSIPGGPAVTVRTMMVRAYGRVCANAQPTQRTQAHDKSLIEHRACQPEG